MRRIIGQNFATPGISNRDVAEHGGCGVPPRHGGGVRGAGAESVPRRFLYRKRIIHGSALKRTDTFSAGLSTPRMVRRTVSHSRENVHSGGASTSAGKASSAPETERDRRRGSPSSSRRNWNDSVRRPSPSSAANSTWRRTPVWKEAEP